MYELLIALIIVLFAVNKTREHFLPDYLGYLLNYPFVTTNRDTTGAKEIVSAYPETCPEGEQLDGLLCYRNCPPGFYRKAGTCWAETYNTSSREVQLEPCPDGWVNDGLTCRQPINCDGSWKGLFGECWGKLSGGRVVGRLNNGGICDWPDKSKLDNRHAKDIDAVVYKGTNTQVPENLIASTEPERMERKKIRVASHPEKIAGLCYEACPKNLPERIKGMWYLCSKEGRVSAPEHFDIGRIPSPIRLFGVWNFPKMY